MYRATSNARRSRPEFVGPARPSGDPEHANDHHAPGRTRIDARRELTCATNQLNTSRTFDLEQLAAYTQPGSPAADGRVDRPLLSYGKIGMADRLTRESGRSGCC
jgi:hypothetical protein